MNDLEQKLRNMGLAGPSADLDRRISETLEAATQAPQSSRSLGQWWRLFAVAASGVAAVFILVLLAARHRQPESVVYRIEAKGRLRQLLLEPPSTADNQPRFTVNGSAP
jgi:hypothetical protein